MELLYKFFERCRPDNRVVLRVRFVGWIC